MRTASITERLAGLGSGKWAVHVAARRRAAAGEPTIELTIGEPDLAMPDALAEVGYAALKAGRTRYGSGRAEPAVADALAARYSRRTGRTITRDNILAFPGTQTALSVVMMGLAEAGDEVLLADPYYATYEGVIRATGAELRPVPLSPDNGFRMRAEDLAAAVTPRCRGLLLNSPHNPTGATLSAAEIAAIGEVCRAHDLFIVSDEVYEDLVFDGPFASPLDIAALADRTVAVSSVSKSHAAPGLRSGWAVGPPAFMKALLPLSETLLFGGQPFIADMTAYALTETFDTADRLRANYFRRAKLVVDALGGGPLVPMMPDAGMFILVDVASTGLDGQAFAWRLLEDEGVAVMPGGAFGEEAAAFVRLSLTVPDERLAEACLRMGRLAARLAPQRRTA